VFAIRKDGEGSSSNERVRWRQNAVAGDEAEQEQVFDAVVICNGHYTEPRTTADIPVLDAWPRGKQMHSHSYCVLDLFADQVWSSRRRHLPGNRRRGQRLPGYRNLWLSSMVERADEDGTSVVFRDGRFVTADVRSRSRCFSSFGSPSRAQAC
jgi:hypothetical protein